MRESAQGAKLKYTILAALIAATSLPLDASAVTVEVGAGVAKYTTRGDMTWYQEGFPHKLDLNAPAFEIGLSDTAWQRGRWGVDWFAGAAYLGNVHTEAWATPQDVNYNPQTKACNGECLKLSKFVTNGHSIGLKLTLAPTYTYGHWKFALEAGAYVYRPTFHGNAFDVQLCKGCYSTPVVALSSPSRLQVAPVIGGTLWYKSFGLSYTHYFNRTLNDPAYAVWRNTDVITLRYRF